MAKSFDVYEWRIENFSCWDDEVHGDLIVSPKLALRYVFQMILYPRGSSDQDKRMKVCILCTPDKLSSSGNLSFIDSDGSILCTKQTHTAGWNNRIYSGLTFEEVAAKMKNSEDRLTLRLCVPSEKDHSVAESTTLHVLNVSLKIDPVSIQSLESDDSKNISIIRYCEEKELLLKAVRKDETVEFILELLAKPSNAISVECQWSVQCSDKSFERNEEKKYLFYYCEPWKFSNSLNWCEMVQKGVTMLLNLKIINGDKIDNQLQGLRIYYRTPGITAVPKEKVSFFDQNSVKSKDSATSNKTGDSVTALVKDLMCLYQDQNLSDFQLKCHDVTFPVHKLILSARSPVFKTMISTDMKESASGMVDIGDLDPSTLSLFLTYLYTGAVKEELQCDRALKLYYAADKYQVPSLKTECANFLSAEVSLSNVCEILSLAHKHGNDDLKLAAQDFVLDNYDQVLTSKEWGSLVKAEPSLVAETLTSFAAKSSFGKISPK